MSQLTSHILDTTQGKPAADVTVILYSGENDNWTEMKRGKTNMEGRINDLLADDVVLQTGIYKLRFETKDYFDSRSIPTFYPYVEIVLDIATEHHYHIPLLLNPFGYTTYRGS